METKTSTSIELGTRKRHRLVKSCIICRKLKVRCDQVKPACGSCTRRGRADLCDYELSWKVEGLKNGPNGKATRTVELEDPGAKQHSHAALGTENQIDAMNERIRHLEQQLQAHTGSGDKSHHPNNHTKIYESPVHSTSDSKGIFHNTGPFLSDSEQVMDFYNNLFPSPLNISQGPFTWVSLFRKDIYLNAMVNCTTAPCDPVHHHNAGPKTKIDEEFSQRWQVEDVETSTVNTCLGPEPKEKDALSSITEFLKRDPKLVWLLVDKFFNSEFYIMMALIDKDDFLKSLSEIIGQRSEKIVKLRVKRRYELSTLGILLLIMRMASLTVYNFGKGSYFPNGPSTDDQYIKDHPIDKDIMMIIFQIHRELRLFKEPRLEIFQFHSMRICFGFMSPEDFDCVSCTASGPIGYLLQYGVLCGLNRDPALSTVGPLSDFNVNRNLLRRLWYNVVYMDSHQLLFAGSPPIIDPKFYDTHFPHLDESKDETEYAANLWFYKRAKLYEVCYPLLMLILNVREKPKVVEVKKLCVPLLDFIQSLDKLDDILKKPGETVLQRANKLQDLSFLIDSYSLLHMVYYHLLLFYNERRDKDQSLYYFIEMVNISTTLYPLLMFMEPRCTEYDMMKHFGSGVLLFPKIEHALHRISESIFAITGRLKALKMMKGEGPPPDIIDLIDNMVQTCTQSASCFVSRFMNISDTYYHVWVISKIHALVIVNFLADEPGKFDESKMSKVDAQVLEQLSKTRHYDSMFERYQYDDFVKMNDAIMKFRDIESKYVNTRNSDIPQWTSQTVSAIEQRWLDQMLHSMPNEPFDDIGSELDTSSTMSITDSLGSSLPTNIPHKVSSTTEATVGGVSLPPVYENTHANVDDISLNNLINNTMDWNEVDRLIQNYGITSNPYNYI